MLKIYFLNRMTDLNAWIGMIGFLLEPIVHRDTSTLFLCLFAFLIFTPETRLREVFNSWRVKLNELTDD